MQSFSSNNNSPKNQNEGEGGGGETEGADGTEAGRAFYIEGELWNVYESEGYPYFLRASDNHSQWDDPRANMTTEKPQQQQQPVSEQSEQAL